MKTGKNILFLAGSAVFAILLVVFGFLLFLVLRELHGTERELQERQAVLSEYYSRNPFPSPGNVAREAENVQLLESWLERLLSLARQGQIEPEEGSTPSRFVNTLGEKRNRLLALAQNADVKLPSRDFAFGFDRYFVAGSTLPAPEDVPRLSQQLAIIDNLCGVLFEEKISEIVAIERQEFEGGGVAPGAGRRGMAGRLGVFGGEDVTGAGLLSEGDLYTSLRFVLEFKTKEKALISVLNRLSRHSMFCVIKSLAIDKEVADVKEVKPKEDVGRTKEGEEAPAEGTTPEAAKVDEQTLPRRSRIVSGLPVEKPMRVVMCLDVYRFRSPGTKP